MINVNVFAKGDTWLFGDLKQRFEKTALEGVRVTASEAPIDQADVWIAIRTHEAAAAPDLSRTLACIHDCYQHDDMYRPDGIRGVVHRVAGLVLSHPSQRQILQDHHVSLENLHILERPLGALAVFTPRQSLDPLFQIGWFGRKEPRKRPEWLIRAVTGLSVPRSSFVVNMVGDALEPQVKELEDAGINYRIIPGTTTPSHITR